MLSFLRKIDPRRAIYLNLVGSVEAQLRDVYARLHDAGLENQTSLAKKLGVGRSVINRRLTGQKNMTLETVADMVWALGASISVKIDDPLSQPATNFAVFDVARIAEPARGGSPSPIDVKKLPAGRRLSNTPVVEWKEAAFQ